MRLVVKIISLLVLVFRFSAVGQYTVSLIYDSSAMKYNDGYTRFSSTLYSGFCGKSGQPDLPTYELRFLLPPDADLTTASYVFSDTVMKILEGQFTILPAPPVCILGNKMDEVHCYWPDGVTIKDRKDVSIYEKNDYFPTSHFIGLSTGMGRQYKIVSLNISPYCYNPVTLTLRALVFGKLTVRFEKQKDFAGLPNGRIAWFEKTLRIDNDSAVFQLYELPVTIQTKIAEKCPDPSDPFIVQADQFRIPLQYIGNVNKIRVYSLTGKILYHIETSASVIRIPGNKKISSGVGIVKIERAGRHN